MMWLLVSPDLHAQGELPVDMFTGQPMISIPLASVASHGISDAVALQYNAGGVRVAQPSGYYGMGWIITGGGIISRTVRGLPDDFTGDSRRGWFYKMPSTGNVTVAASVKRFANSADTLGSTFTDEAKDYDSLNKYSYTIDTEPDMFSYSFGSYSGNFVFDNSTTPAVRLIPFVDIKIDVTFGSSDKTIQSFTITTNDGVKYLFGRSVSETRTTKKIIDTLQYSKREYSLYSMPADYNVEWNLTSITSPLGATLSYDYTATPDITEVDTFRVSIISAVKDIYSETTVRSFPLLSGITAGVSGTQLGDYITLSYDSIFRLRNVMVADTRATGTVRNFSITYQNKGVADFPRYYLTSIKLFNGCTRMPPWEFEYRAETDDGYALLPEPTSKSVDFWGYYNAKPNTDLFPALYYYPLEHKSDQVRIYPIGGYAHTTASVLGADRTVDPVAILSGVLSTVHWPAGGSTILTYEPNQYYDPLAGKDQYGGGLRVSSVTYFDGISSEANISKNYVYTDSLGHSSGRLIQTPVYAVPTMQYKSPTNGAPDVSKSSDWTFMMVRTEQDLSSQEMTDGSPVGYQEVKVYRAGAGYSRYHYLLPGTYGAPVTTTWKPTIDKIARSSNISSGIITNGGPWIYPYATNQNFNFERGLVWLRQDYDENHNPVRETQTYYQYLYKGSSADSVRGIAYDFLPNSGNTTYFYGAYSLVTDVAKVLKTEKVTTFDAQNTARSLASSTSYFYGTGPHRLLTQIVKKSPDGTQYFTRIKYPLDYGTVPSGADTPSAMIGNLQTNFRNGTAVETTSLLQRPGSVKKYTGASVVKYSNFGTGTKILPQASFTMSLSAPLDTGSFTASAINPTTKNFVIDSHYESAQTITSVDSYGNTQSSTGTDLHPSATGWTYSNSLPNVSVNNATNDQVGFMDFETTAGTLDFTITGTPYYGNGHTGARAVYPLVTLSKTVTKAPGSNYVLSFWINSSSSTSFAIKLFNGSGTQIGSTMTVSVPSTGGSSFVYFSKIIPVTGVTTSTMKIQLQAPSLSTVSADAYGLMPVIDDLTFIPEAATLTSTINTLGVGVNAVTTGNQTSYTLYDGLGRKKYVLDTYKNILERDTYTYPSVSPPTLQAAFSPVMMVITDGPVDFNADASCLDQPNLYQWSVNGSAWFFGTSHQTLTIPPTDSVTVSLKVSNLVFSQVVTHKYPVVLRPLHVVICAQGAANVQICDNLSTVNSVFPSYACSEITAPSHASGLAMHVDLPLSDEPSETVISCKWYQKSADSPDGFGYYGTPVATSTSLADRTFVEVLTSDSNSGYDFLVVVETRTSAGTTRTGSAMISNSIVHITSCAP